MYIISYGPCARLVYKGALGIALHVLCIMCYVKGVYMFSYPYDYTV